MKKNSKDLYKDINNFFEGKPTVNQKAWGLINEFYNLVLNYMEDNRISRADLARELGKSRAAISQMFNKTPNITIKRMVEIADSIGLDLSISSSQINTKTHTQENLSNIPITIPPSVNNR